MGGGVDIRKETGVHRIVNWRGSKSGKASVSVIFLTVFIDLIGFGIVVPLVPVYSKHYQAGGFMLALILASFSAMQFVFSPVWGRWSDRIGRRPMLLLSTAGASMAYALLAIASGLENHTLAMTLLLVSRILGGICGGNIAVAQAYVADITPPEMRSRRMGLIGMAFGLGFIFGPVIGGQSLRWFGITGPGWVAAGLCAVNFLLASAILVESRQSSSETALPARPHLAQWTHTLRQPGIGFLVGVYFVSTFCFSCFECTLPLMVVRKNDLSVEIPQNLIGTLMYLYAYCGLIGALVQGFLTGHLVNLMGESRLMSASLVFSGAGFAVLPFVSGTGAFRWDHLFQAEGIVWWCLLGALAMISAGAHLTRPPLFGLLSRWTSDQEQGANIGVAQSAGSLARILGPFFAAPLFIHSPPAPYLVCALISTVTGVIVLRRLKH
jgi:MFS family permease